MAFGSRYCNWLSKREGLSEDQFCYIPNEAGAFGEGMTIPANVLATRPDIACPPSQSGSMRCRAGTVTSRYFGNSPEILKYYARYGGTVRTMPGRRAACCPTISDCSICSGMPANGARTPIRIIDCAEAGVFSDLIFMSESIVQKRSCMLRGGSFADRPAQLRSADRATDLGVVDSFYNGFRVARTLPSSARTNLADPTCGSVDAESRLFRTPNSV